MLIKEDGRGVVSMLRDKRLSLKAKGLLAYLEKCPEFVDVGLGYIVEDSADKESAVKSAIRECENAGYLEVERGRDEKGRLGTYKFRLKI